MSKQNVYKMDNFREGKIYMRNDLILSLNRLNYLPLKIFELIISKVDPKNPPEDNLITVQREEINAFFDEKSIHKKYILQKNIQELQKESLFTVIEIVDDVEYTKSIVPIPYAEWNNKSTEITFKLESNIMPYISDLKSNFTQYDLNEIRKLKNKYAIILYRMLVMYYNQYEYYSKTKQKRQEQLNEFKNPVINVSELRFMTDTEKKYKRFTFFYESVIGTAIEDINENTNLHIKCDKVRKGYEVNAVQFHITKKNVAPAPPEEHPDFEEKQQSKEEKDSNLYARSMSSKYTKMLKQTYLISDETIFDQKLMIELGVQVYPYYEIIENILGEKGVLEHMRYVKTNMTPASEREKISGINKGIAKYLYQAASNYATRVQTKNAEINNIEIQKDTILAQLDEFSKNDTYLEPIYNGFREQVKNIDVDDTDTSEAIKQEQIDQIQAMIDSLNNSKGK